MASKKGSMKKSNLSSMSWAKNVGKSLGYSAMDIITEMMPATMENIEVNKDTMTEMYQSLRKSLRGKSTKRLDDMLTGTAAKNYDTAKTAIKNAMEDFKTGNLYNKERMLASFDDGFDMDFDFDFSDDLGDSNFDSSSDSGAPTVAIPNITINSNINKSNPMVKAVETQSQVILETSEATMKQSLTIARSQMTLSENMQKQLMGGIQTINENLSLLVNFQSINMTKYITSSMKYFDDNMKLMTDMFETYKKLNVPEQKPEQNSNNGIGIDDILTYNGGFDIKNYVKLVKKQIGDALDSNIITSSIKMMLSDTDTLASMATQPLKFVADGIVKKFIPNFLKESLSSFDKSLNSFIPAMLMKITGFKDSTNPLLDLVGKVFGLNIKNKKTIDTSLYEKGKVPFDGITRKSIVEVIPGYLSKIYSALSGKEELVYDYEKGKFSTASALKKEHTERERRTVLNEYSSLSEIKDRLNAIDIANAKEKEDFAKRLEDLFMKITDREGLVNPNKKTDGTDELAELFEGSTKELELARALINSLSKDQIMKTFGKDVIAARQARTKLLTDLENNPGSLGAIMFNELYSKDNDLSTNNPLLKSYGHGAKTKRTSIFNPTDAYGNTSTDYLRDIKKILLEGINVFVKKGRASIDTNARLNAMNSERIISGLRDDGQGYNSNSINNERIASNAERGIVTLDSIADLPDDPRAQEEIIKNYVRIRDEEARGQNQKGFGISISKFLTGNLQEKFNSVREIITNILSVPANGIKKFFDKINDSMYDLVFGKQEGAEEGESFFSAVIGNVKRSFGNFFGFLRTKIYDPLKESLFGKEGLITKIKESDQWKQLKANASRFGNYLFGEKNAEGIREGGLFSDTANEMGDMFKSFKYYFTGKAYKNSKGEEFADNEDSVFGNVRKTFASFKDTLKQYFFGNKDPKEKTKGVLTEIGSSIRQGFQNFADAIFGPKMIGGKKNKKYVDMEKFGKTMKEHAPKALAHGVIGAGFGVMASIGGLGLLGTLIGGPLGGAAIGIAGSFLSRSEKFKNWLFGEKDVNGERIGGFINKSTQKFLKDNKVGLVGGATVGAIKGLLGIGFLPSFILGGPISGAIFGMATQFALKSETMQKFLFGEKNASGARVGGVINKIMNKTTDKEAKKRMGNIGAGMLGGLGLGFITSHMGILGALSIGPIGGAIAGAAAGIALSSDKWKKYLFGEVDEDTGEKKGGLLTKFSNFMKVEVFQALKVKLLDWKFNIQDWFSEKIAEPFLDSLLPVKEEFSRFKDRIKKRLESIAESIKNSKLFKGIKDVLVDPILEGFNKYIFQPFKTLTNTLITGTAKLIGKVVAAPFSMLNKIADRLSNKHRKEGKASVRRAALENIKNSDFVVGMKEVFAPVKESFDEITDYAKQKIDKFTSWIRRKIGHGLRLLGKGLGHVLLAPFQLIGLPFKGIGALTKFIKSRRNPEVLDGDRIDSIYAGGKKGLFQNIKDYAATFNPFSKVSHDAQYYELNRESFEQRVLNTNKRFSKDASGKWIDSETGKEVDKDVLSKLVDKEMSKYGSGAYYESERKSAREKRAEKRAAEKKQRDELREDMKAQLNINRQFAREMGYDNFDEDGKFAGVIYKDIDKQMEAQYGKDYKKKSKMERDEFKRKLLENKINQNIEQNTKDTASELKILTKLMEDYLKKEKGFSPNGDSPNKVYSSDEQSSPDENPANENVTSGIKKAARYAKNEAGRWYDTVTGKFVKKEVAEGRATSADDPRNNADNPEHSHEDGLDKVPFDGYKATLHKDEAVVPKKGVKIMDKIKNVGSSAAGFIKSFTSSIGNVFSKSLAEEDARDDAEEAAKAEAAEDAKALKDKHSFTSRKTAAFMNEQKAKLQEKEEEKTFRSKVLEYLSSSAATAKAHMKNWNDTFGLKEGLITLALLPFIPTILKFIKGILGLLTDGPSSLIKENKEFLGYTDEDGDRTNASGDTQVNSDAVEAEMRGALKLTRSGIRLAKTVKNTVKYGSDYAKYLRDKAKGLNPEKPGKPKKYKGAGGKVMREYDELVGAGKKMKSGWTDIKEGLRGIDEAETFDSGSAAKGVDDVAESGVRVADEVTESAAKGVDDVAEAAGKTATETTTAGARVSTEVAEAAGKTATETSGAGVRVASELTESAAKGADDVAEAVIKNSDSVAKAADDSVIAKFIDLAKKAFDSLSKLVKELVEKAGGKVGKKGIGEFIEKLTKYLTKNALIKSIGKITAGITKIATSTATFLLSDAVQGTWGAVTGASKAETANLFGVREEDATAGMRTVSAIMKTILSVSYFFIIDILNDICIAATGFDCLRFLAEIIYGFFAGEEALKDLKLNQEEFTGDYNQYLKIQAELNSDAYKKDENGNIMLDASGKPIRTDGKSLESADSYNDRVNKSVGAKIWGATKDVGDFLWGHEGNKEELAKAQEQKKILDEMLERDPSLANDPAFMQSYKDVQKAISDNAKTWGIGTGAAWLGSKIADGGKWLWNKGKESVDWLKDKGGQAVDWVKGKAGDAKEWVTDKVDWLKDKGGQFKDWLTDPNKSITDKGKEAFDFLKGKAGEGIDWLKDKGDKALGLLPDEVETMFRDVGGTISTFASDIGGKVSDWWNADAVDEDGNPIIDPVTGKPVKSNKIHNFFSNTLVGAVTKPGEFFKNLGGKVSDWWNADAVDEDGKVIKDPVTGKPVKTNKIHNFFSNTLVGAITKPGEFLKHTAKSVSDWWNSDAKDENGNVITDPTTGKPVKTNKIHNFFSNTLVGAVTKPGEFFKNTAKSVSDWWNADAKDENGKVIKDPKTGKPVKVNKINNFFTNTLSDLLSPFTKLISGIKDALFGWIEDFDPEEFISDAWDNAKEWVTDTASDASDSVSNFFEKGLSYFGIGGDNSDLPKSPPTKRPPIIPEGFKTYSMKENVFIDEYGIKHGIGGQKEMELYRKYKVNSGFRTKKRPDHTGVDLDIANNAPIYAFTDGVVTKVVDRFPKDSGSSTNSHRYNGGGFGNHVYIQDKFGNTHIYGHLNDASVKKGEEIKSGDKIGEQGNTGNSTGSHLHYEVRTNLTRGGKSAVNPKLYLENYKESTETEEGKESGGIGGEAEMKLFDTYRVTSEFRPSHRPNHNGMDLSIANNAPIYAFTEGNVTKVVNSFPKDSGSKTGSGFGNHVYVQDKFGNTHIYAHLNATSVREGDTIKAGHMVGEQGHTGRSTGSHLHYEVRTDLNKGGSSSVNPKTYLTNYDGVNDMTFVDAPAVNGAEGNAWDRFMTKVKGMNTDSSAGNSQTTQTGLSGIVSMLNDKMTPLTEGLGKIVSELTGYYAPITGNTQQQSDSTTSSGTSATFGITGDKIGDYVKRFESGSRGSAAISNGSGDNGGVSFGTYQFPSYKQTYTSSGNLPAFWNKYYASKYPNVKPGDNEPFKQAWTQAVNENPTKFAANEWAFIKPTYYDTMLNKLNGVLDPDTHSRAAQEMVWSSSVQYGPNSSVLRNALSGKNAQGMTAEELINTVQDYKANTINSYFSSSSSSVRNGVRNRHDNGERNVLLGIKNMPPLLYGDVAKSKLSESLNDALGWATKNDGIGGENDESISYVQQQKDVFEKAYKMGEAAYEENNKVVINNKPSNIPEGVWDKIIEILSMIAVNTGKTNDSIKDIATVNKTEINTNTTQVKPSNTQSPNPMYDVANQRRTEVASTGYKTAKLIAQGVN